MICYATSCHGALCCVMSCYKNAMVCHAMLYCVMSCHVIWMFRCVMLWHAMSCCVMSCPVISCHAILCYDILCHVVLRYVASCHVIQMLSCVMFCHVVKLFISLFSCMVQSPLGRFFQPREDGSLVQRPLCPISWFQLSRKRCVAITTTVPRLII